MYSIGAGVPCLCLPNGRDQDDNAARRVALGFGRVLPPFAAPDEIRGVVRAMLEDNEMRKTGRPSRPACTALAILRTQLTW